MITLDGNLEYVAQTWRKIDPSDSDSTAYDLTICLKRIKLQKLLYFTCAPVFETPSNIRTMEGPVLANTIVRTRQFAISLRNTSSLTCHIIANLPTDAAVFRLYCTVRVQTLLYCTVFRLHCTVLYIVLENKAYNIVLQ